MNPRPIDSYFDFFVAVLRERFLAGERGAFQATHF